MPLSLLPEEQRAVETFLACRVVKSQKPGETLKDAILRYQVDIVLRQAGLPTRSQSKSKSRAKLAAARGEIDDLKNELATLKNYTEKLEAPLHAGTACPGTDTSGSGESGPIVGKGKKRAYNEDAGSGSGSGTSRTATSTGGKKAKRAKAPPEPLLLSFRPLDGPVTAAFKRADKLLDNAGLAKKSFEVVWQLRQLQSAAKEDKQKFSTSGASDANSQPDLEKVSYHADVIFSELLTALRVALDGQVKREEAALSSQGTREAVNSVSSLWLSTIDALLRVSDDTPSELLKTGKYPSIEKTVLLKTSQMVALLLEKAPIALPAITDAVAVAIPSPATTPEPSSSQPPSLAKDILQIIGCLASLDGHRPSSRFVAAIQPPLRQFIRFSLIRAFGQAIDERSAIGSCASNDPDDDDEADRKPSTPSWLAEVAELLHGLQSCRNESTSSGTDAGLLSQAEHEEVVEMANKIIALEGGHADLEGLLGSETYKSVMKVAHEVSYACGADVVEALLNSMIEA